MLNNDKIIENIRQIMIDQQRTLSVAESVTSGHLQAIFSSAKDASKFFQGGITAYNAGQKCRHLNIDPIYALENDSVSEKIAVEMAKEVNRLFISDFGISITGYAARIPEKNVNDLFAFFSIAYRKDVLLTKKITTDRKNGIDSQLDYTSQVIIEFERLLKEEKSRNILL